jgi:hypothetical protein
VKSLDVIRMITDEYRMKKGLKVLQDISKLTCCKARIDLEKMQVYVEFSGIIKDLDNLMDHDVLSEISIINRGGELDHVLTSGIAPLEFEIMARKLRSFQKIVEEPVKFETGYCEI